MKAGWIKATSINPANDLKKRSLKRAGKGRVQCDLESYRNRSTLYQFLSQIGIKGRNIAKCIKRLIRNNGK